MVIESTQNETVKKIKTLHTKKGRDALGLHLIEGIRVMDEALNSSFYIPLAFVEEGHEQYISALQSRVARVSVVTRKVMETVSQTDTPQWICACVQTPDTQPPEAYPRGMLVILDAVQDPGNLGTILRTADAMGACGILLGEGCADAFAPKALRAAMGSVYHIPVWRGKLNGEIDKLLSDDFSLVCGHLGGSSELPRIKDCCALVIGNEGNGVSEDIAARCYLYKLPMYGKAESLNASVAAGILMYSISEQVHRAKDCANTLKK